MSEIATKEIPSKPLIAEKDETARNLNIWLAEFESLQIRNFYSEDAFHGFYTNFRRLWTITQHEKDLQSIMYGKVKLLELIVRYFNSDVRNNYLLGIRLARAYLKALFGSGILSLK
jgi:5-methylcytosine-specific restriction endonuclease McrBC regulatory subunit McrC